MARQEVFGILIDMLIVAFNVTVSKSDYHDVVQCMRMYDTRRATLESKREELRRRGWPVTYHPCEHMEKIRFCMTFGGHGNERVRDLVGRFHGAIDELECV